MCKNISKENDTRTRKSLEENNHENDQENKIK